MARSSGSSFSLRTRLAIYGSGFFSEGGHHVVIPLWLTTLDPSPLMFGIVMGARSFVPLLLSIHGGALMDRLGVRRLMVFFAVASLVLCIAYPLMPWVWAVLILNLITGFSTTMSWVGVQTLVGRNKGGHAEGAGWLSFTNRLGGLACPLLAGIAWDVVGPYGSFAVMVVWCLGLLISGLLVPMTGDEGTQAGARVAPADLLPRLSDYIDTFRMLALPAVALVVIGSVLNIGSGAIQSSFYVAYLENIGLSGTLIGVLVAMHSIGAAIGALGMTRLLRWIHGLDLMNVSICVATAMLAMTPLLGGFLPLFLAMSVRGLALGVSQPLFISLPMRAVPREAQGAAVGLRMTLNRLIQTVVPVAMGGIVEVVGLEGGFLVVGGFMLAAMILFTVYAWGRLPDDEGGAGRGARA